MLINPKYIAPSQLSSIVFFDRVINLNGSELRFERTIELNLPRKSGTYSQVRPVGVTPVMRTT